MSSASTEADTEETPASTEEEAKSTAPETDRQQAISELREVRDHARYKVFGKGRIRSPKKERVRIQYLRVLVHAANTERQLLKDRELEDMMARLEELETRMDEVGGVPL